MVERRKKFFRDHSIRYKLLLTFLLLLFVITVGITFFIHYYNKRFISDMMEESNKQIMREMNAELDSIYSQINQMYITFNNQNLYEIFWEKDSGSDFEQIQKELQYENLMKNLINANNLQDYIIGMLLYVNSDAFTYVGKGVMNSDYFIEETPWYEEFSHNPKGRLFYGPLTEDFKTENSTKKEAFYFIRSWYIPTGSGIAPDEYPFILFSIDAAVFTNVFERFSGASKVVLVTDAGNEKLFTVNMEEKEEKQIVSIVNEYAQDFEKEGAYFDKEWAVIRTVNDKFGWIIYSAESTRDAFRDMNQLLRNIYLIILITGGAAILLAMYFTRKITMPLTSLNQMMNKIEEKDVFLTIETQDELGQIGERFNQMKRRMQDMAEKVYLSRMQEKEAQLSALQAQINPHFLYNTLDNIYCIAQVEGSEDIASLTENLSKMMRYSMSMKIRYVPLVREVEHVKSYVDILNVRFDNSIILKIHVAEDARNIEVPKLSMQPLAENAWNHGILLKAGHRGTIQFQVSVDGDECIIQVLDDGVGISPEKCREINQSLEQISYDTGVSNSSSGSGIALKNVNSRIMLEDGENFGIRLYPREEGGCQVIVRMKLHRQEQAV